MHNMKSLFSLFYHLARACFIYLVFCIDLFTCKVKIEIVLTTAHKRQSKTGTNTDAIIEANCTSIDSKTI